MVDSSGNRPGFFSFLGSVLKWVAELPVIRQLIGFFADAYRHYRYVDTASAGVRLPDDKMGGNPSFFFRFGIPLLIVFLLLVTFLALAFHSASDPSTVRLLHLPISTEVVRVRPIDLVDEAGGGGQVLQSQTVNLTSRLTANVTSVPVNLGDLLSPDTTLFELDAKPFQAALISAQQNLAQAEASEKMAEQQDLGYQALKKLGLATEQDLLQSATVLETAQASVATDKVNLINAQLDLEATVTKSPVTGIVLQRFINANERIIPNQPTFQLGDLKDIYFLALIGEDKIYFVRAGLTAELGFPAFPGVTYEGKVFYINPNVDPTSRCFTAYIRCANPGLKLKPGLTGFAQIKEKRRRLVVPDTAIFNTTGDSGTVFVITEDNHASSRIIRFGVTQGGWTEIVDGLKEGELVSVNGAAYLKDGDRVRYHEKQ